MLLYGNRTVRDILMKDQLDAWAEKFKDRFRVVHVIGSRWSNNVRFGMGEPQVPRE